jgi:hypothetical protein
MKTPQFFASIALGASLFFAVSCDKTNVPQQVQNGNTLTSPNPKTVLAEHFTGHFCYQCISGDSTINSLEQLYSSQVIPLAIHSGFFAEPSAIHSLPVNAPQGSLGGDFRTAVGDSLYDYFQVGALPLGMINRTIFPVSGNVLDMPNAWQAQVAAELAATQMADLQIVHTYDTLTRQLDLTVNGLFMQNNAGMFMIKTVLAEDSVYEWMVDNNASAVPYYHRHVLRDAIDHTLSAWGDTAATGQINQNATFSRSYTNYLVSPNYNDQHCYVIAYLYDNSSKQVLQAVRVKVR